MNIGIYKFRKLILSIIKIRGLFVLFPDAFVLYHVFQSSQSKGNLYNFIFLQINSRNDSYRPCGTLDKSFQGALSKISFFPWRSPPLRRYFRKFPYLILEPYASSHFRILPLSVSSPPQSGWVTHRNWTL